MGVTHSPSAALIAHKPAVCGRDFPIACLRTASRASTASNRGGNVFFRFAPLCASLARCSVPAHFVCSALQPFGPSPFCKHLLPKNTRNDVHAVISDESFVLPILCQCSGGCERTAKVLSQPLFLVAWLSVFLLALYHLPGMNRCPQFDTARNRFFFSSHENFFILLAEGESI